jgi:hypothetical protein
MPWMGVGVYFPGSARGSGRGTFVATFGAFVTFVVFFAALFRATGFFAAARFFMPRTVQPPHASVNAPGAATARR